ncbi:MAG: PilZ domain-containing protein [Candidatus Omnitrophica bacterium]|nr:PilZ domain-containing protein [Candidatus Omnitrophota bacterium]
MVHIELRRVGSIAVLDCSGSIDIDAAAFIEMIGWCLENGFKEILCNFENVNFVDYAGLSVIAVGYKDVVNRKGAIKFLNVPAHIKKLLCMVHLDEVFEVFSDESVALKSFEEDKVISEIQHRQLRRRFKRLPLELSIEFKSPFKTEDFHTGKVLNISGVGLLMFVDTVYPLGEILRIRLPLQPKPGMLEMDAKVVWLVQKELQPQIFPGMGLEFHNLDTETQKMIVEYVERNLPLSCSAEE